MNISCCANQQRWNEAVTHVKVALRRAASEAQAMAQETAKAKVRNTAAVLAAASGARVELYVDKVFVVKSHISNLQGIHARIHKHTQ